MLDPSHANYKDITAQTDVNGHVLFSGLYAGTYELTEPNPISGFVEHKFVIEGNLVSDLNIELPPTYVDDNNNISNRAMPAKIKLLKWSTLTNSVLAGAQFKLYKQDGTEVAGPVASDANGIIEFNDLYPGDGTVYVVKEVSNPTGYETADDLVLPTLQRGQALDLTSNSDYRINNNPIPVSIKVLKRDKYYHTPLAGAEFWLYKGALVDGAPQGEPISKKTTAANGTVVFSGLSPKTTYVVKEMVAPQHYSLSTSDENIQVVKIDTPGSQKKLTYNNIPNKGSIKVNKTIDGSPAGSTLDTVSFRLVGPYIDTSVETPLPGLSPTTQEKTLSNGTAIFTNLVHGQYRLFEIADSTTSGNYKIMQGYRVVTVGLGEGQVKEDVDNEFIKGYLKITKQDADTYAGDPYKNLQGIIFKVYSDETLTNLVDTMTTNASGIAKSKKLNPGTYYVKETFAPNVYELNDTIYPVEILYSQGQGERITPLTVTNTKKKGNFALRKLSNFDNTIRLSGAEFTFTNQRTGEEYSLTTDADGYAELLNLAPGNYLLKETVEPHGYDVMLDMNGDGVDDVDGLVVEVFPGRTTQGEYIVNIYNDPEEATVSVTKFQAGNHNVRLGGVRFALYRGSVTPANKIGASNTTDVNGKVGWNNLDPGDYILVEEATIAGYIMPDDPNTEFTLEPGEHQVITIDNKATPGSVKVLKQDKYYKTPLAGAEFWLYEGALVDGQPQGEPIAKKTTGTDGIVVFGNLSLEKTYVIVEFVAPQHYSLAAGSGNIQVVSVSTPGAQENLTFRNEPDKGALKVNKTIDGSPAGNTLDTVSFRLVGPYVDATAGTIITGHDQTTVEKTLLNGTATFNDLLHGQYRLYELADSAITNNYNVLQGYKVVTGSWTSTCSRGC